MGHSIQNFDALAESEQRRDALAIAEAGYEAINIGNALRRKLKIENAALQIDGHGVSINLQNRKVFFVGIGKCAFVAAQAIEQLLGERLTAGIAFDVSDLSRSDVDNNCRHLISTSRIEKIVGTHPLPNEVNVQATEHILQFLSERTEEDLIIMLISGGGSTLICAPEAPMTYQDEVTLFKELTAKGATIQEMNTVRKHTSRARGGGLARAAFPAEVISLIVSDVPGNDIAYISSGPTVRDASTIAEAETVFARYDITPPANTVFTETPKEEKFFERVTNVLFLTNQDALAAMQGEATRLGYTAEVVDDHFSGEARTIGHSIVEKLHAAPSKTALLYAGESTVMMDTPCPSISGTGGRNQEMALAALEDVRGDELVLPFASDGHDNTDHAGAIADAVTIAHARARDISSVEYLAAHRSYDFFKTTGDALQTGYTGSNVSDLIVALKL
ncbi:MAG: DUF4147 domain-containing protein [Candidatus Paceibacterota bacterium]|jgi:glycerate-2-kinase